MGNRKSRIALHDDHLWANPIYGSNSDLNPPKKLPFGPKDELTFRKSLSEMDRLQTRISTEISVSPGYSMENYTPSKKSKYKKKFLI